MQTETPLPVTDPPHQPAADQTTTDPTPAPGPVPAGQVSAVQHERDRENLALQRAVSWDPQTPWEAAQLANQIMNSTLIPEGVRFEGKWNDRRKLNRDEVKANLVGLIMWGRQWKLPVWTSINAHIIDGKPTLAAATCVAIVQESKLCHYMSLIESDEDHATWETVRVLRDGSFGPPQRMSYTRAQAQKMGYFEKGGSADKAARNQWNTQPEVMLRWRAAMAGIRVWYPGLIVGLHSTEELIDAIDITAPEAEWIRVQRTEVDTARRATPIILGLPSGGVTDPVEQAFQDLGRGGRDTPADVLPAQRKPSSGDRLRERAEQTKAGKCSRCGGMVLPGDKTCDACRNE